MDVGERPPTEYQRCRKAMIESGSDPSLLLWMKASRLVLQGTDVGQALLELCAQQGVTKFNHAFQTEAINNELTEDQNKNSGLCFSDRSKQGALDGLNKMIAHRELKGPLSPFLIQGSPGNGVFSPSVFVASAFARTGIEQLDVMRQREGYLYKGPRGVEAREVITMFEHSPVLRGPCFLFLDWEALSGWWKDSKGIQRRTAKEIADIALRTPEFVYNRMLQNGMLDRSAELEWIVKDKSRTVKGSSGEIKVSYHFIGKIAGISTVHHKFAAEQLFRDLRQPLGELKKSKCLPANLSENELDAPWWGIDIGTMGGNGGFATPNSRKTKDDPDPIIVGSYFFQHGQLKRVEKASCLSPDADASARCKWIRSALFTVPPATPFCNYTTSFLQRCNNHAEVSESRTLMLERQRFNTVERTLTTNSHPTTSQGGTHRPPPFDALLQLLPPWLRASTAPNMVIRDKIPFLTRLTNDLKTVFSETTFNVVHVQGMFCPYSLHTVPPQLHYHTSNGVYLVITHSDPVAVYAKCSYCQRPSKLPEGTQTLRYGWIKLQEDTLPALIDTARAGPVQGQTSRTKRKSNGMIELKTNYKKYDSKK